ncbi:uncharacterized protein C10orf67, mitochondrial isoform X2 [Patella vulgata]|uniref:uncharacterized protein C10orf67, mitochondrial isoform X2 n=1 Tax=Patella vulgata TaxID=6465 RepID=UPI00217F580D|nr:uncharacterized protein C10orf67, mitochondrial isoform X2 [Patella vulgata]
MASSEVAVPTVSLHEYNLAEQELQDRIFQIYGTRQNEIDLFRPSLADQQKIGFFSLDRGSQTDVTEVLDLKEMTEVIQILLQDVETLRKDINVTKHVMQADYESKLQEKSLDLYCRINEKVAGLEKMHDERIQMIRKAYRQQLSDAIARVAVLYNKNLERKISKEKKKQDRESGKIDEKYRDLQNQIQKNEAVIHMLQLQLQQYQQNASLSDDKMLEESLGSLSPEINHEAEELREQLENTEKKLKRSEDQVNKRSEEVFKQAKEIAAMKEQLQREKNLVMQLQNDKLEMKQSMENDKASTKRTADRQKKEMEKLLEEKLRIAKEEINSAAAKEAKDAEAMKSQRITELMEQNKLLEEQLMKEKLKIPAKTKPEVEKVVNPTNESALKEEISRLKKEIERIHRTWEKKFTILQQSLHALKDESYLRQTLQRQAANLHHAAVSYAVDSPVGIVPARIPSSNSRKPLPDIPKQIKSGRSNGNQGDKNAGGDKDNISYTVSAPSGRGTTILSIEENQIMSDEDGQDIPVDVKPLPAPPQPALRTAAESEDVDGRPSTVSHVVILPSA